jgi:hypothetical protein
MCGGEMQLWDADAVRDVCPVARTNIAFGEEITVVLLTEQQHKSDQKRARVACCACLV